MRYRFVGESDNNFTKNRIYEVVNFQIFNNMLWAFIADDNRDTQSILYTNINKFNQNWQVY